MNRVLTRVSEIMGRWSVHQQNEASTSKFHHEEKGLTETKEDYTKEGLRHKQHGSACGICKGD